MFRNPKELLGRYGLRPKKSWGQNFLVDSNTVERIVDLIDAPPETRIVELGAGTGVLTHLLAQRYQQVFAIERDQDLVELLQAEFEGSNVQVIPNNAAKFRFEDLPGEGPLCVIGNLPYQISTPILFHLLEQREVFQRAVLMMQKEVADRLSATPEDGKDYSTLSIRFSPYFHIDQSLRVSRNQFHPRPKVDSVVVTMDTRETPAVDIQDEKWFAKTVKIAFAQRRKTLYNNLVNGFRDTDKAEIQAIIKELSLPEKCRGETLTIEQFALLANHLQQNAEESSSIK